MSKRRFRRHDNDSDSEEEDKPVSSVLADVRDMQKLRKRPAGLNINELVQGTQSTDVRKDNSDPLKLKTGGMIDMRKLKRADLKDADIEEGIKQTFSKESHLRDEDEEMRKYVEEELSKRKGQQQESEHLTDKHSKSADDVMYELPENLKRYQSKRTEDMLSNQMLCGIPEVDLGIEAKIRNIEETETAKLKLLKEAIEKKKNLAEKMTAEQNRMKDAAKNYVQHNIYNIQETTKISSETKKPIIRPRTAPIPIVDEDTPKWVQDGKTVERPSDPTKLYRRPDSTKPTDKQVVDKFKNKFVRHQKKN